MVRLRRACRRVMLGILLVSLPGVAFGEITGQPLGLDFFKERPSLVLVVVLDQFRADYLTRFLPRFLPAQSRGQPGGFQYLLANGATFFYGQYELLQNMTGPGHATIMSGAYPYQDGIPVNYWYDARVKSRVYCAEDQTAPTVGVDAANEHVGTSPRKLLGTTVGDELKNAGYPAKNVSISLKDRAAIMLGGHRADIAIWIDPPHMQWVSSRFYLPEGNLPAWVQALNHKLAERQGKRTIWKVSGPGLSSLLIPNVKPLPSSLTGKDFGLTFPHQIAYASQSALASPVGVEMTEDAAEQAIKTYKLGQRRTTDVLTISYSGHDYLGHAFGPNSREMEEMTAAEDRSLAKLFAYVQKAVPGGLKKTLIVLTADHGIPANPDWLRSGRINAGRIDEDQLLAALNQDLQKKFGDPGDAWFVHVEDFNFFLNATALSERNASRADVEAEAKRFLLSQEPNFVAVLTSTDYERGKLPPGALGPQMQKSYYPGRSGDVIAIPRPYFFAGHNTVDHMTGYNYDRTVPIMFAGPHIKSGVFATPAHVVDIAPTLSFMLGIIPPSLSEGRVLDEILTRK